MCIKQGSTGRSFEVANILFTHCGNSPKILFLLPNLQDKCTTSTYNSYGECVYDMIRCLVWHDTNTIAQATAKILTCTRALVRPHMCLHSICKQEPNRENSPPIPSYDVQLGDCLWYMPFANKKCQDRMSGQNKWGLKLLTSFAETHWKKTTMAKIAN